MKLSGFADEMAQDLVTQVTEMQKLGISHIEMRGVDGNNLIYHSDEKVNKIKAYLDDHGMALSAVGSPIGKIGLRDDMDKHFEAFQRAVEIAHKMECDKIRAFSFYVPEEAPVTSFREEVLDKLGRFVEYAKAEQVIYLHENEKGIYGEKAEQCLDLMKTFYGSAFQAVFDFANFVQAKEDTLSAYAMLKPYISYIHVKDAKLADGSVVPAGYGDGHVAQIVSDLNASGFDGFYSLEPHLFHFQGFAQLEKEGISLSGSTGTEMDGITAFTVAYKAFMHLN